MEIGKVPENVLKRSVFKKLTVKRPEVLVHAGVGEDCAVLAPTENALVLSTDPITASAKEIGTIAFHITANDIASSGAELVGILLTIIMPPNSEEGELKLLRHDVLEDMLEEKYQEGSKRFLDFTAAYSTGRNDKKIEDLILKIYEFSRSYPDSEAWLGSWVKFYEIPDVKALEGSSIMKKVMTDIRKNLEDAKELLIYAENVSLSPEGPAVYEATLEKDLQVIEELCNRASYKRLAEAFSNVK